MYVPVGAKQKNLFKLNNLCSKLPFLNLNFFLGLFICILVYSHIQCKKNSCISYKKTYRWGVFSLKNVSYPVQKM